MSKKENNFNQVDFEIHFSGTQINYFFVCKRKLWLYSHNMELESDSDLVVLGKLLHENSFKQKSLKEIEINRIKIDFFEKTKEVHEIKRSRKIENAHIYQLLYYLYYLEKNMGINAKGILHYPLLKKKKEVILTKENELDLQKVLVDTENIIKQEKPPEAEWKSYCKHCAYNELCWG